MKERIGLGILGVLTVVAMCGTARAGVTALATSHAVEYDALSGTYYGDYDQWSDRYSANPSASTSAGTGPQDASQDTYIPGCQCIQPLQWQGNASSAAAAWGGYGTLHARGSAGYSLTPFTQTVEGYNSNGQPYSRTFANPFYVRATGSASASFNDSFVVSSSTLRLGDTVSANFVINFDATLTNGTADVGFYALQDGTTPPPGGNVTYADTTAGSISVARSSVATLTVGERYDLFAYVDVVADVPSGDACHPWFANTIDDYGYTLVQPLCGQQFVAADAGDTASFYIAPLSTDFTIAFESDHDYSLPTGPAAVPEPASLAVWGIALAGLGVRRRRRAA